MEGRGLCVLHGKDEKVMYVHHVQDERVSKNLEKDESLVVGRGGAWMGGVWRWGLMKKSCTSCFR